MNVSKWPISLFLTEIKTNFSASDLKKLYKDLLLFLFVYLDFFLKYIFDI